MELLEVAGQVLLDLAFCVLVVGGGLELDRWLMNKLINRAAKKLPKDD